MGKSALILACSNGYAQIVELLLRSNKLKDINYNDNPEGISAIYAATKRSRKYCIELLLNHNIHRQICDLNVRTNTSQQTPIFVACDKGDIEIIKLLINYKYIKCDLNAMEKN